MSKDKKDLFKDYVPQVIEFDEEIDGCDEYKHREDHLNTKEDLLKEITKAKEEKRFNKKSYR